MCPACRKQYLVHYLIMTYHRDCYKFNTMEAIRGTDTPYLFAAPEFTHSPPAVYWGSSARSLVNVSRFIDRCLSVCPFFLAIAFSVLLRFTDSDYPFGTFKIVLITSLYILPFP